VPLTGFVHKGYFLFLLIVSGLVGLVSRSPRTIKPPQGQGRSYLLRTVGGVSCWRAVVPYDPATGDYIGPDGKSYTEADLAHPGNKTWQSMLVPPTP